MNQEVRLPVLNGNQVPTGDGPPLPSSDGRVPPKPSGIVRRFIRANIRASRRLDIAINPDHGDLYRSFRAAVREEMARLPPGSIVADLGGGRQCDYMDCLPKDRTLRVIAVDISEEELRANQDVSETRVADVSRGLPFADGEVALILSRYLFEHIESVPSAIEHMGRVLAPGGVALHFLPCRYSTFGTAARVLPFDTLLRFLHWVLPDTKGKVEFDVVYDRCYPSALERAFREAGFRWHEVQVEYISTAYFFSFLPAYLLVAAYEKVVRKADARSLAAYIMVRASR